MIKFINKNIYGFTLVEMTVVLVIIGLLLAGLLVPLREGVKQERRVKTLDNMKTIEEALYGFAVVNGRLPCPDCRNVADGGGNCGGVGVIINDGIEDFNGNNCAVDPAPGNLVNEGNVIEGNLPWVSLGVEQFDEWESWFTYAVTDSVADAIGSLTPGNTAPTGLPACVNAAENLATIDMCPVGNITIQTYQPNVVVTCAAGPFINLAQNVFAVVLSHGENVTRTLNPNTGLIDTPTPAFLCNEAENSDSDNLFISSSFVNPGPAVPPGGAVAGGISELGLDDQLIWISPQILKSKLVQAGRLP